jgi:hypothetical protein
MEGTVESKDISNWILFCQKFVQKSLAEKKPELFETPTILKLMQFLEISKEDEMEIDLQKWIAQRIKKFA